MRIVHDEARRHEGILVCRDRAVALEVRVDKRSKSATTALSHREREYILPECGWCRTALSVARVRPARDVMLDRVLCVRWTGAGFLLSAVDFLSDATRLCRGNSRRQVNSV